jgi:hypothetical protein
MIKNQNDLAGTDNKPKGTEQKDGNLKKESIITQKPIVSEEEKETGKVKENGSQKPETKAPAAEKTAETETAEE